MQAVWDEYAPRTVLAPPSKEMKIQLAALDAKARLEIIPQITIQPSKPKVMRAQREFAEDPFQQRFRWRNQGHGFSKSIFDNVWGDRLN